MRTEQGRICFSGHHHQRDSKVASTDGFSWHNSLGKPCGLSLAEAKRKIQKLLSVVYLSSACVTVHPQLLSGFPAAAEMQHS